MFSLPTGRLTGDLPPQNRGQALLRNGYAERPLQRDMLTVKGRLQDVDKDSMETCDLSRFCGDSGSMMSVY